MNKNIRRQFVAALLLCLIMLLLCACNFEMSDLDPGIFTEPPDDNSAETTPTVTEATTMTETQVTTANEPKSTVTASQLVGTWRLEFDISESIATSLKNNIGVDNIGIKHKTVTGYYIFDQYGIVTRRVDINEYNDAVIEEILMPQNLNLYLANVASAAGMTAEELYASIVEMTGDADAYIEKIIRAALNSREVADEAKDFLYDAGIYALADGELYLKLSSEENAMKGTVRIVGDKLYIDSVEMTKATNSTVTTDYQDLMNMLDAADSLALICGNWVGKVNVDELLEQVIQSSFGVDVDTAGNQIDWYYSFDKNEALTITYDLEQFTDAMQDVLSTEENIDKFLDATAAAEGMTREEVESVVCPNGESITESVINYYDEVFSDESYIKSIEQMLYVEFTYSMSGTMLKFGKSAEDFMYAVTVDDDKLLLESLFESMEFTRIK